MRTQLAAVLLAAFANASVAQSHLFSFTTIPFPAGWKVEGDGQTYLASPVSRAADRSITAQVCTRKKDDCGKTCARSDLQPNFFYFFDVRSNAEYFQPMRTDGFQELKGVGTYGHPPTWVAATVLCGPLGIVYIGATSASKAEAESLLSDVAASMRVSPGAGKSTK